MLRPARSHGKALHAVLQPHARLNLATDIGNKTWNAPLQRRWGWSRGGQTGQSNFYEDKYPAATKLKKTGIFSYYTPKVTKGLGDRTRVNLVNKKLADNVISYIKPSLERHKGCDLISVYPGAGLFAKALHDAVQPRSHLLLEPDETLYKPFLKPLLNEPNVKLIPKSGIVWHELQDVLTPEHLPNQVEFDRRDLDKDPPRNDTLLVHLNLAMYPKRRYGLFDSMSRMVLFQLINSIRTSTQFQKYGLVRMLVWVPDEEKVGLIPRTVQSRKKAAIEAELATEYIAEVCGKDVSVDDEGPSEDRKHTRIRPQEVDLESMRQALVRMREGGHVMPRSRQTTLLRQFKQAKLPLDSPVTLVDEAFTFSKAFMPELEDLQEQADQGLITPGTKPATRLKMLINYNRWLDKVSFKLADIMQRIDDVDEQYRQAEQARAAGEEGRAQKLLDKARQANDKYNADFRKMPDYVKAQVNLVRDQLHVMRQPESMGPVMSWDRRPWEPLKVQAHEFFPNQPCTLIDIQPKAPHRMLRHVGPGTSNAGDIFDLMLTNFTANTLVPLAASMDHIWPGAREDLEAGCRAVLDPATGGSPLRGDAAFATRAANQAQLLEILERFMSWPFRPGYHELVGRLEDDSMVDDSTYGFDEEGPAGMNLGNTAGDVF